MQATALKPFRRPRQLSLPYNGSHTHSPARPDFGGNSPHRTGKRKTVRPFDPAKPLHLTLRSSYATRERSMLHPKRARIIKTIVYRAANRRKIRIRKYVCVGNHLHILIQTQSKRMVQARPALRNFLREITGLIARVMTGAEKGRPFTHAFSSTEKPRRFWDGLVWSRIIQWGKDLKGVTKYFLKNEYDAIGILAQNCWPLESPHNSYDSS